MKKNTIIIAIASILTISSLSAASIIKAQTKGDITSDTKLSSTTIALVDTIPAKKVVTTISIQSLYQRRDFLQTQLDLVNAEIQRAAALGVQ